MDPKVTSDNFSEYFINNQNLTQEEEFSCYICSATYEKDLQLAAELGKTLLERNKELETSLKNYQNVIEDQSQEIQYLVKQTAALKEVNSSRIRIYEQLEISIQELEHSKETLSRQNVADKKQIKNLQEIIKTLENKCDELQSEVDRLVTESENEKRQRNLNSNETNKNGGESKITKRDDKRKSAEFCDTCVTFSTQLQEQKTINVKDQKMMEDLRQQVDVLLQENNYLQVQANEQQDLVDEIRTMQEELATLEQIRLGNLCKRCLRSTILTEDCGSTDDLSLILANEEEQELAKNIAAALFSSDKSLEGHLDNPYRMLVDKYEALVKMQEQQPHKVRQQSDLEGSQNNKTYHCMSLRDELQLSGNFYNNNKKYTTDSELEDEQDDLEVRKRLEAKNRKPVTSSPGFSDEVVHKGTQTEVLAASLPGSFLCKISDGNDCQFSIYDDASPVESRFRKTPKYRPLFKEIFAVLKRAAEAKDEGELLPLLDDRSPMYMSTNMETYHQPKVPPVTPAREEQPFVVPNDEAFEVSSSVDNGSSDDNERKFKEIILEPLSPRQEVTSTTETVEGDEKSTAAAEMAAQRDVMEQLMAGVRPKRNLSRGDRRALAAVQRASPSPSPCHSRSSSKRRSGSKARKKRERLTDSPSRSRERHQQRSNRPVEDFASMEIFSKVTERAAGSNRKERPVSMFAFGSGSTSASMEVAKLKILEKSYAEVLRMGRKKTASVKSSGYI